MCANVIRFKPKNVASEKSVIAGFRAFNEGLLFYNRDEDSKALNKFLLAQSLGYESAQMFAYMAWLYNSTFEYDKALVYAKKSLIFDDTLGFAHCILGDIHYNMGEIELALKSYFNAIEYDFITPQLYIQISEIYRLDGFNNYLKSLDYATRAVELEPDNFETQENKARFYYDNEEYEKALKYFLVVENMGKKDFSLYYKISYCYSLLEDFASAMKYANKAVMIEPSNPLGYYRKGFVYQLREDGVQSTLKNFLKAESLGCDISDMYDWLGYHYLSSKDFDKSIEYAKKGLDILKNNANSYYIMACCYSFLKNDNKMALRYFNKAYKYMVEYNQIFYEDYCQCFYSLNRKKKAFEIANEGLEYFSSSEVLNSIKIDWLIAKKEYIKAENLRKRTYKNDKRNLHNAYLKLRIYQNRDKDYDKCIKLIRTYLKSENREELEFANVNLCFAYLHKKNYKLALDYLYEFIIMKDLNLSQYDVSLLTKYYKKLSVKLSGDERLYVIAKALGI